MIKKLTERLAVGLESSEPIAYESERPVCIHAISALGHVVYALSRDFFRLEVIE